MKVWGWSFVQQLGNASAFPQFKIVLMAEASERGESHFHGPQSMRRLQEDMTKVFG
jgi:hypothetical protein